MIVVASEKRLLKLQGDLEAMGYNEVNYTNNTYNIYIIII